MDSENVNRVSLAALGSILFAMLLVAFSHLVISPKNPAVPGFALPTSGGASATAAAPAEPPAEPLPALLAKADAKKGEQYAKVCQTCHNFEKGAGPKIGPPLWGVVGRPIASVPGFAYSDSLKAVGGDWTWEALNVMVSNPKMEASGTKMAFPGEKDPQRRADILAFLQTLSDSPVPFPK
jgi:cytochrome c